MLMHAVLPSPGYISLTRPRWDGGIYKVHSPGIYNNMIRASLMKDERKKLDPVPCGKAVCSSWLWH